MMKKLILFLLCIFMAGVLSTGVQATEEDYVNIKNAVVQLVSQGKYQEAVNCIDTYSHTVADNAYYYADLQADRVAIREVIGAPLFQETVTMIGTLHQTQKFGLCILYIDEQLVKLYDCPNYVAYLQQQRANTTEYYYQAECAKVLAQADGYLYAKNYSMAQQVLTQNLPYFQNAEGLHYGNQIQTKIAEIEGLLTRAKFGGSFSGENINCVATVDEVGTVIEYLEIQKNGISYILADDADIGFIYTETDKDLTAMGAFLDQFGNSGYVKAYAESGILYVEILSADDTAPTGKYMAYSK